MDHLQLYIHNNLGSDLGLHTLASMLYLNKDALRKMFLARTGMPISLFIQKVRIERACLLLREHPRKSMEEIAEEVGYNSLQGFYKTFEKIKGYTPKYYITLKND